MNDNSMAPDFVLPGLWKALAPDKDEEFWQTVWLALKDQGYDPAKADAQSVRDMIEAVEIADRDLQD